MSTVTRTTKPSAKKTTAIKPASKKTSSLGLAHYKEQVDTLNTEMSLLAAEKALLLAEKDALASQINELNVRVDIMNMTSIVSESDLKGDILNINEKFIEISKYSREELIGHPHNTTRHPDMPKEVFKEMWSTIGRGKPFRGIIKNRAKDGTPYYVDAVIAPVMGPTANLKSTLACDTILPPLKSNAKMQLAYFQPSTRASLISNLTPRECP